MDLKKEIKKMQDDALDQWRENHHNYWAGYAFACRDLMEYMDSRNMFPDEENDLDINYIDSKKERLDSFRKIATHFGKDFQREKLEEELIELLHATNRINNKSIHDYDEVELRKDFIEETGDVLIMITQVIILMNIGKEVGESVDRKIQRTLKRILQDNAEEGKA